MVGFKKFRIRQKKKLSWQKAKFEISAIISFLMVEIKNFPNEIHPKFYVNKIRLVNNDSVPG